MRLPQLLLTPKATGSTTVMVPDKIIPPEPTATTKIKLSTVEMDPKEAKEEHARYMSLFEKAPEGSTLPARTRNVSPNSVNDLDHKMANVYLALANNLTVVNIEDTIRNIGQDRKTRPLVAIANASWRGVILTRGARGDLRFEQNTGITADRVSGHSYNYPEETLRPLANDFRTFTSTATVPLIPPKFRPDALDQFAILWEPLWTGEPTRVVDPILLRPLGGSLFTVIAAWDVTAIEQAILRGL